MTEKDEITNIYKKPPAGIGPDGTAYTVIIVDDSKAMRQLLKQMLLSVNFNVIEEFENGATAAMTIKNKNIQPDYMFVDVEMPVMNGIELVKEIQPVLAKCKIYMVTSQSDKEKVEQLIKLGIAGYIKKPYDRDTLIEKITGKKTA